MALTLIPVVQASFQPPESGRSSPIKTLWTTHSEKRIEKVLENASKNGDVKHTNSQLLKTNFTL